ncbi:MAG: peptide deformylase [Candidatus Aminicenantaceae bacterium]|jgi:peptide deformylase
MIDNEMTILEILVFGHPVLATKADEIKNIDDDLCRLANNMVHTMHAAPGIGLAAPQVNQSVRLITMDLSVGEKNEKIIILANPEILDSHGETILEEGCLSVPDINEKVIRPAHIVVKGITLDGNEKTIEAEGLLARVICHEIDHLNGKLFIEHLSPLKKNLIKKKLRKQLSKDAYT